METSGLGVKGRQAINGDKKQNVAERARITLAATRASQKTAPAINATMTVLYSISLPVCSVLSQVSNISET
jgi:hypothetical protein